MFPAVGIYKMLGKNIRRHALRVAVFQLGYATAQRLMEPSNIDSMHPLYMAQLREFTRADVMRRCLVVFQQRERNRPLEHGLPQVECWNAAFP